MRFLLIIAVAQWLSLQAEISVADWSSVLLKEDFGVPVGPNGYGYAVFTVVQLVARLTAPRLVDRYGLNSVVRTLGLVGGVGYLLFLWLAVLADTPLSALPLMCASYGFMSLGVAVMPPAFATATGAIPGLPSARALMITGAAAAVLNLFGRIGLAYLAQFASLPIALAVMGGFLIAAAVMSPVLRPERAARLAIVR
jgi:MFS family permease